MGFNSGFKGLKLIINPCTFFRVLKEHYVLLSVHPCIIL